MAQSMKDLDAAKLSLQLVTDTLPHHVLHVGAVKQVTLLWLHSTPIIKSSVLLEVLI